MKGYDYFVKFLIEENFTFTEREDYFEVKKSGVNFLVDKIDSAILSVATGINMTESGVNRYQALEICNIMNVMHYIVKFTIPSSGNDDDEVSYVKCVFECEPNSLTTNSDYMAIFTILDSLSDKFMEACRECC